MTEKEQEALSGAICKFVKELVQQADEFQIDRDSYVRAAADMFQLSARRAQNLTRLRARADLCWNETLKRS